MDKDIVALLLREANGLFPAFSRGDEGDAVQLKIHLIGERFESLYRVHGIIIEQIFYMSRW